MRPTRLQVEGFTAFRRPTDVDFDGADLFAFTGPTGAGKSSLLDAMVFALYGTVHRLGRRAVAPIISLGAPEAKVRLDFTVGGESYTAVRVVRRTSKGATTKEARLERTDGEVLAGTADELTEAVTSLLGLSYEHFVKCVVLPQGEFAALLHDSGADRGDLLVRLLDLGLYERMAGAARQREQAASGAIQRLEGELAGIAEATPEQLEAAHARIADLERLTEVAATWSARLAALKAEEAAAVAALDLAHANAQALGAVRMPEGVSERATAVAEARLAADAADAAQAQAAELADAAEVALAALPPRRELEQAQAAHAELAGHRGQQEKGAGVVAEATEAVAKTAAALAGAEVAAAAAADALEAAQWEHKAHDLAARLQAGEPCPVCEQVVDTMPAARHGGGEVASAKEAKRLADAGVDRCRAAHAEATRQLDRINDKLATIATAIERFETQVAEWPDAVAIEAALAEVLAAETAVQTAVTGSRTAARAAVAARRLAAELVEAQAADQRAFDRARDALAPLGPPPADRADLAAAWAALLDWAGEQLPGARAAVADAEERMKATEAARAEVAAEAADTLAAAGLPTGRAVDPAAAIADALGSARAVVDTIEAGRARAEAVRTELAGRQREADLARSLAQHLAANRFEKWVLDEVLVELCARATEILRSLSDDAYSLDSDAGGGFVVIDHRNADEPRSARTLSGGETFLASLALALALADQVGQIAAHGAARIESLFLDEGFGSLDPDTLDIVAAAIEELGSQGRMIGLISHVAELAERVPVRFVVAAGPAGSTVTKVVA